MEGLVHPWCEDDRMWPSKLDAIKHLKHHLDFLCSKSTFLQAPALYSSASCVDLLVGRQRGPSYQRQYPSALDSIFLIVNFHSCVTAYPGSFTTMDLHCYFLEMHPLFICCINQASKMKGEFHAPNLAESIKANAILSVWWHLWSLSMPFSTHLLLHEITINILRSSFTLPIWGCDWSWLTPIASLSKNSPSPGVSGSSSVLAPSQPRNQIHCSSHSPCSIPLQRNHLQAIEILAKILWGEAGASMCKTHRKTPHIYWTHSLCLQPSHVHLPCCAQGGPDTYFLMGCSPHSALPSESQHSWPVPLDLMPHSREGGHSPLFTLCLPSDPLVFSGPNALAVTTSVSASLCYALSLTPALAGRTLDTLNL